MDAVLVDSDVVQFVATSDFTAGQIVQWSTTSCSFGVVISDAKAGELAACKMRGFFRVKLYKEGWDPMNAGTSVMWDSAAKVAKLPKNNEDGRRGILGTLISRDEFKDGYAFGVVALNEIAYNACTLVTAANA